MEPENPHIGSSLDDLLAEDGTLAEVNQRAIKAVLAWQINQAMEEKGLTKTAMAERMNTSRAALDRLLDPANPSVTLATLDRAASVLGKRLAIDLVDHIPPR
ncbi:Fis family transcriptional regulator [Skermanella stibiiresistens SB22]|uniref:Fis family transcriptional regulator n=1 Tax=Skermanella stibiiresistens SB22 TaxID=1385369 RepID=W9GUF1_9PROT|nr:helix-turn-helix transcriptional regulator [Skermanella stibiiresistens]EWY37535.1 Fis family transcriptional regulator [Skermanella stibiiresistens SB22]